MAGVDGLVLPGIDGGESVQGDESGEVGALDGAAFRRRRVDQVQGEIDSLQRRFRRIESQRRQGGLTTGHLANVKHAQLVRIKDVAGNARDDLRLETAKARSLIRHSFSRRIGRLQDEAESFHIRVRNETHLIAGLDKQIERQRRVLARRRQNLLDVATSRENVHYMERRLFLFESKLDGSLVKFSEALSQNKRMRDMIDDLRRERATFDGLVARNEKELDENKADLGNMMQRTLAAFEGRERIGRELVAIKDASLGALAQVEAQWNQLVVKLRDDSREQEAILLDDVQRVRDNKAKSTTRVDGGDVAIKETQAKALLVATDNRIHEAREAIAAMKERVAAEDGAFNEILLATGLRSIDDLVSTFVKAEDDNFFLFARLTDVNFQIEAAEHEIGAMESRIATGRPAGATPGDARQGLAMRLIAEADAADARAADAARVVDDAARSLDVVKGAVEAFVQQIGLSDALFNESITDASLDMFLMRVERETNRLVELYLGQHQRTDVDRMRLTDNTPYRPLVIVPPDLNDDDNDDDDGGDPADLVSFPEERLERFGSVLL